MGLSRCYLLLLSVITVDITTYISIKLKQRTAQATQTAEG